MNYQLPDTSRLAFDARLHAYKLDDSKFLSGVTQVISGTSAKDNLLPWAARMVCEAIREEAPKTEDGRYLVSEPLLQSAEKAHTRKKDKAASKGTDTHALVEQFILDQIEHKIGGVWPPEIQPFITWAVENDVKFISAEQRLYSEKHGYAGTADFIALIDGKLTIGDLKTYPRMWDISAYHQLGAYAKAWEELTGETPQQSVIVRMCDPADERLAKYGTKPFAVYWRYATAEDMEGFLSRLTLYRQMENFVPPKD